MKLIKLSGIAEQGVSHNPAIRKQVIVENGEIQGITNYARAIFPPGEKADSHRHEDMTEVFSVESGCGEIRVNDVAYVFAAGTTVIIEPGDVHEIINTGADELILNYFSVVVA